VVSSAFPTHFSDVSPSLIGLFAAVGFAADVFEDAVDDARVIASAVFPSDDELKAAYRKCTEIAGGGVAAA